MANGRSHQALRKGLRKAKRLERALERKAREYLNNDKKPSETVEVYVHPWSQQNLGNPHVVDEMSKRHCCGCSSCMNICPVNAITMQEDSEGFLYPFVDREKCIECGQCVKHCPAYCSQPANIIATTCFATVADDYEMRLKSSSGGLFTQLARYAFAKGGVVFGAAYASPDTVHHIAIESEEGIDALRRSKYVQSSTGTTYKQVKRLLKEGRFVLYSGCPCQIAGLLAFLGEAPDNLLTVDLICHGSPSPGLFRRYIHEDYGDGAVREINFRDKSAFGWSTHMNAYLTNGAVHREVCEKDPYYLMFLRCMAMRPFCSICKFTRLPRVADLSIGDWWGIEKYDATLNDRRGTSLLIVNNEKGSVAFESIRAGMARCEELSLDKARPRNYTIDKPFAANPARSRFFTLLKTWPFDKAVHYALNWHYDVGIYGLWYGENYGSMLTYYGLRTIIEEMGLSTVMIENPYAGPQSFTLEPHRFAERQGYLLTKKRSFPQMHELNSICDSFLLGSDQLWNPDLSLPYGFSYFLDFVQPDNKRIAYGTSFGNDTYTIDSVYMERSAYELAKFDALSVRDDFSRFLLREKYNITDVQKVLDPAILCDARHYRDLALQATPIQLIDGTIFDTHNEDYIFVYILDPNEKTLDSLAKIAGMTGKKMLYALDYDPNARAHLLETLAGAGERAIYIMETPTCEQWLKAVADSSCVLTDSFHGTIFAYVFKRDFAAIPNERRGAKRFSDLLEMLGLQARSEFAYIGNEQRICELLSMPIDYAASDALLAAERDKSLNWLKSALLSPKKMLTERAFIRQEEQRL